jgi:hypothetical protein
VKKEGGISRTLREQPTRVGSYLSLLDPQSSEKIIIGITY